MLHSGYDPSQTNGTLFSLLFASFSSLILLGIFGLASFTIIIILYIVLNLLRAIV